MTQTLQGFVGLMFAMALAAMASSCGGSGGSCGKVQPCGGDVVGNYTISGACYNSAAINMDIQSDCPGASVNYGSLRVSGSASFNADMTYSLNESVSATVTENIPTSCFPGITCVQLDQAIREELATNPQIQSARCSGGSVCQCTIVLAPTTMNESGTYTTSGTTLTTTSSTGSISSSEYCVQGDELHVVDVDMSMAMAMGSIQADIVFKRN